LKKKSKSVKVLVGGAPVTDTYRKEIGADGYSGDASGAVEVAKKILR
jgi:5-methyltetrahydrofolate--homocysteine methyltransferase